MHVITPDHRQAIARVARRFNRLGFHTLVSDGEQDGALFEEAGRTAEPHIAVMEGENLVRWVVVETRESLEEGARQRWSLGTWSATPLWVYVPRGLYGEAWRLIVENRLRASLLEYEDQSESDRGWAAAPRDAWIA